MSTSNPLEPIPFDHVLYVAAGISLLLSSCVLLKMVMNKLKSPEFIENAGTSVVYMSAETDTEWSDSNGIDEMPPRFPSSVQMTLNDFNNVSTLNTEATKGSKGSKNPTGNFYGKAAGKQESVVIAMEEDNFPIDKKD